MFNSYSLAPLKMGGFQSTPRVKHAIKRVQKTASDGWWLGGTVLWTAVTAAIVLAIPVFFEYERECQMFEQMQQMQAVQMQAAEQAAGLNH